MDGGEQSPQHQKGAGRAGKQADSAAPAAHTSPSHHDIGDIVIGILCLGGGGQQQFAPIFELSADC
jgi:hypothetical protein